MNKNLDANGNAINAEVEEVTAPADDATDEEKAEYITKLESQNKQLFARTKKAEGFELVDGKWVKPAKPAKKEDETTVETTTTEKDNLSSTDVIVLMKNNITEEEDIAEVADFAKYKKISIAEALKSPIITQMLADKAEARKVAEGTNTGGGRRGAVKVSDEKLLQDAEDGKYPESDADIQRLIALRRKKK